MSRGFVKVSPVRILLLCRGGPGRFGSDVGDGCRRDVAWELTSIFTYGGFPRESDSCQLVVVLVVDMMRKKGELQRTYGKEQQSRRQSK